MSDTSETFIFIHRNLLTTPFLLYYSKSILLCCLSRLVLYSSRLHPLQYFLCTLYLRKGLVWHFQMRTILVYLGCVGALLIVLVVLVFFSILIVSQSILTLLDFVIQVEVSISRSHFILVQFVLKIDSLWLESLFLFFFFCLLRFNYFLLKFLLFRTI